ncbi:hypothetical protein LR48_Vigan07g201800 [Vigna angularis]|uniref:Putative plant transposon protein domain-containing protein n=1 Tax=Phaseolus angularis TaxID=3914 RepID=A0A0L9V0N1_PHAAN|nr:hypothetical protein LR48_Vigan07g201800 [Vigna angularis]
MASSSGKRVKTLGNKRKDPESGWIPSLAPQFGEEVERRGWEKLAAYPKPANIAVVKEFYTNARPFGNTHTESYMSYVRGKIIRYDPETINMFIHAEWDSEQCQFALSMDEGVEFDDVERTLCVPRGRFQRNRNDVPVHIRRSQLTALSTYWMAFTHANIHSCSHVSDIIFHRAVFLYCVMKGLNINIGQVIANEPSRCHHHIILEFIGGYHHQHRISLMMHNLFQMRDMYMSLMESRMQALHRRQVATIEMIIGLYDTPPSRQWTMDEFNTMVGWPKDQAQASGAGAAEASAMEDDDEDDDYEDGDEEEEDDDEEEDSD